MNNMSKIIKRHNKKLKLKPRDKTPKRNCRKKAQCPMERKRQVNDIVYRCDITSPYRKKSVLDLPRENGRAVSITTSHHLYTRYIPIRQQFQVPYDT